MTRRKPVHRRRKRQSGAIYIEGLTVIGLILVAMECTWGLYRFCMFQHRAQLEARTAAWEASLQGCGESQLSGVLGALSKSSDGNNVSGLSENSQDAPGWVDVQRASDGTVGIDLPATLFGRTRVAANQHFSCNEAGNHQPLELIGGDATRQSALDSTSEQGVGP